MFNNDQGTSRSRKPEDIEASDEQVELSDFSGDNSRSSTSVFLRISDLDLPQKEITTELRWTINNFRKLRVRNHGDCLTSQTFHSITGCHWNIALYPVGNKKRPASDEAGITLPQAQRDTLQSEFDEAKKHCSLYLRLNRSSTVSRVRVTFKFFTQVRRDDTSSGRHRSDRTRTDRLLVESTSALKFIRDSDENSWGFPKALKRNEVYFHMHENYSLTIRCVISMVFTRNPVRPCLKRKRSVTPSPDNSATLHRTDRHSKSPDHSNRKFPNPKQERNSVMRQIFANVEGYIEKRSEEKVVDGMGDSKKRKIDDTKGPGPNVIEAITKLIMDDKIDEKLTLEEKLDIAMWCNRLEILLAERTFYWLICERLTFERSLKTMQHHYFQKFQRSFQRFVFNHLIENIHEKRRPRLAEEWQSFVRRDPRMAAELYGQLMDITNARR